MNDKLFKTLLKKYDAMIEDALFKIDVINDQLLVIPEHINITEEVDKQLQIVAECEDKLFALRQHYGKKEADRQIL
tara:strand:+ start:669 stop:896 length:228 start_codon:yes stop_codon:yes gene_type:complete